MEKEEIILSEDGAATNTAFLPGKSAAQPQADDSLLPKRRRARAEGAMFPLRVAGGAARCGRRHRATLVQLALIAAGGVQVPSMIEGGLSSGQYMRIIRMNLPAGAGSQFASLSAPGESFWM